MAENHRRVESRQIVGTGMATDPQRLQEITDEQARRERAWRDAPERGFGDVLQSAPAKGALADDVEAKAAPPAPSSSSEPAPVTAAATPAPPKKATSSKPRPQLPDPRERVMRARLAALESSQLPKLPSETTGNSRSKKTP